MTTSSATAKLAFQHLSALRWQLIGAVAMGWALGGCEGSTGDKDWWRQLDWPAEPQPQVNDGPCPFGDAGVECYSIESLDAIVDQGWTQNPTFTDEGCVDPATAAYASVSCGPYPVSSGVRRGAECCYYQCYNSPGCGRPFVVEGEARVAATRPSHEWTVVAEASASPVGASAEIGREWLRDALAEHASVAAFSAFNLSLLALGAPAELVHASAAATLDEVLHARACFELARDYGGESLGPGALDLGDLHIETDLAAASERAFLDGCIGETAACLIARASLDACDAPHVRAVLARIAEDEARHAELAWQFVAWALRRGGDAVAQVLSTALDRRIADCRADACRASEPAPAEWHRAGRLSEAERSLIIERTLRDVARPMLAALLSQHRLATSVSSCPATARERRNLELCASAGALIHRAMAGSVR